MSGCQALRPDRWYTTGRVARAKGCSSDTILRACRDGSLPATAGYDVNDEVAHYLVRGSDAKAWDQPRPRAPKRKRARRA